jgi:FKBP-type peptidyl-prolyl cis-trans isomerase
MSKKPLVTIVIIIMVLVGGFFLLSTPEPELNKERIDTQKVDLEKNATASAKTATLSGELKIEDLKVGSGREVKSGDTVKVHYLGTLVDGSKFDSSYDRNEPFTTKIGVGQVIQGWDQGIVGMKVGGKRKLTIPPSLGYGDQQAGKIPANSILIFEVELLEVK